MLPYPAATTREEKLAFIQQIINSLLDKHGHDIAAIGAYGSIGQHTDGPYSDIEIHVVSRDGVDIPGHELIYHPFKLEISTIQKAQLLKNAQTVDDGWAIKTGSFIHILPLYDPDGLFQEVRELALTISDESIRAVMREFMIWEPYETMGKIRNNRESGNFPYVTVGSYDLTWQTAKLIGLANKRHYSTRARTFEESLSMPSKPEGYIELAACVMSGEMGDKEHMYQLCENLWTGLNRWYEEMGIEYRSTGLPF